MNLKNRLLSALTLLLLTLNAPAQDKPAPQVPDVAAPKNGKDGQPDANFLKRHEGFVQIAKAGGVDLLFLGDSITDGTLTKEIMPDFLHLSVKGYQIWADAISGKLDELMK